MKKTLHGKRHIRARASVRVGREKRRLKKIDREFRAMSNFLKAIKTLVPLIARMGTDILNTMGCMASAASEIAPSVVRRLQDMYERKAN